MAIKGHKKGNIAINRFDDEAVAAAVKDCIAVAESASEDEAWDIAPKQEDRKVVQGRITSYNVCYTKLLRKSMKQRELRLFLPFVWQDI